MLPPLIYEHQMVGFFWNVHYNLYILISGYRLFSLQVVTPLLECVRVH
jgi:hypothetical protein